MMMFIERLLFLLFLTPCVLSTAISNSPRFTPLPSSRIAVTGGASVPKSKVVNIQNEAQFNKILNQSRNKLVVVDFTAAWCMPCKMISPVYDKLSNSADFSQIVFTKIDVDNVPELARRYQVRSMPSFLFIKNGKVIGRFSGADQGRLVQLLKGHS